MSELHSYGKIYNFGHRAVHDLLDGIVVIEEKIDGSQFSFGIRNGELLCRSKGVALNVDAPDSMFARAVATAKELAPYLPDGWTYRGEYLQKPKHNALAYDRTPAKNIILFDIDVGDQAYLTPEQKRAHSTTLGLETVPVIYEGVVASKETLLGMLERLSVLGGQKVEGIVVKNYAKFGEDKKVLMGKHVSEAFKEVHRHAFRDANPRQGDILQILGAQYRSKARWNKAIQHITETRELFGDPRDIGPLIKEIQADVLSECEEEIKDQLFAWAKSHLSRMAIQGFPEWYKEKLLEKQFDTSE